jgi:hypothetical protein
MRSVVPRVLCSSGIQRNSLCNKGPKVAVLDRDRQINLQGNHASEAPNLFDTQ